MKKTFNLRIVGFICSFFVLLFGAIVFCACKDSTPSGNVSDVEYELELQETLQMNLGETKTLQYTYEGQESLSWTVENPAVVSVENGIVTANSIGSTTLTATVGEKTATCIVNVGWDKNLLTVKLNTANYSLYVGDEVQVTVSGEYNRNFELAFESVEYTSSDETCVSVSETGALLAKKVGQATVLVNGTLFGESFLKVITVSVEPNFSVQIQEQELELYPAPEFEGQTYKASCDLYAEVFNKGVKVEGAVFSWVDDAQCDVVTVDQNGTVTALNAGTETVRVIYTVETETFEDLLEITVVPFTATKRTESIIIQLSQVSNGYQVDMSEFSGETDDVIQSAWLVVDGLTKNIAVQDNVLSFDGMVVGESVLYLQTRNVLYSTDIETWTAVIETAEDMTVLYSAENGWYRLGANIDMANVDWREVSYSKTFTGIFDGCGYTISNLTATENGGLFENVSGNAVIKNVNFDNAVIPSSVNGVGILFKSLSGIGVVEATIENIVIDVVVKGESCGGLVGLIGAGSTLNVNKIFAIVYCPTETLNNGAIVGMAAGNLVIGERNKETRVYSSLPICSTSTSTENSSAETLNEIKGVIVAPTQYDSMIEVNELIDNNTSADYSFGQAISDIVRYSVYGNKVSDFSGNETSKFTISADDVMGMKGQNIEIFGERKSGDVVYYSVSLYGLLKITQENYLRLKEVTKDDVLLMEDINMQGQLWKDSGNAYSGVFDGQGFKIYNVRFEKNGLFTSISGGTIKNLVVSASSVNQGVLAGTAYNALVENVVVSYVPVGDSAYTGLIRYFDTKETSTFRNVIVEIPESNSLNNGFIAGFGKGAVLLDNCYFIGGNGMVVGRRDQHLLSGSADYFPTINGVTYSTDASKNWAYDSYIKYDAENYDETLKYLVFEDVIDFYNAISVGHVKVSTDMLESYKELSPLIMVSNANIDVLKTVSSGLVILTEDIDMKNVAWKSSITFIGTLDGCGYSIKNFKANYSSENNDSLFRKLGNGAVIKNLGLYASGTTRNWIAYNFSGTVALENVYVEVSGKPVNYGGLFGYMSGQGDSSLKLTNVLVNFTTPNMNDKTAGGLIGRVDQDGVTIYAENVDIIGCCALIGNGKTRDVNVYSVTDGKTGTAAKYSTGSATYPQYDAVNAPTEIANEYLCYASATDYDTAVANGRLLNSELTKWYETNSI